MKARISISVLAAAALAAASNANAQAGPVSPAAAWSATYLLNSALVAEYEAEVAAQPQRSAFLKSPASLASWERGRFALAAMQARGQSLPGARPLAALLAEHEASLPKSAHAAALKNALVAAAEAEPLAAHTPDVDAGFAAVSASFSQPKIKARWDRQRAAYGMPTPSCPIDYRDVQAYADHQARLTAGGAGANPRALLEPLAQWSPAQMQCLVFTLMSPSSAAQKGTSFDPLPLMQALQQTDAPLMHDVSIKALIATRYLQSGLYPEALALVMDLSDADESFGLTYDVIQRVYSMRQRGDGAVALQGL